MNINLLKKQFHNCSYEKILIHTSPWPSLNYTTKTMALVYFGKFLISLLEVNGNSSLNYIIQYSTVVPQIRNKYCSIIILITSVVYL